MVQPADTTVDQLGEESLPGGHPATGGSDGVLSEAAVHAAGLSKPQQHYPLREDDGYCDWFLIGSNCRLSNCNVYFGLCGFVVVCVKGCECG